MKMKLTVLSLFLIVMMIVGVAQAGPRLTLPESTFNFGYVPQNAKISHVFWLHSTGDDVLKILNVKPG